MSKGKDRTGQTSLDQATTTTVSGTFFRSMAGRPLEAEGVGTVEPGRLCYIADEETAARLRGYVDLWRAVPIATVLRAAKAGEEIVGWTGTIADLETAAATTDTADTF